MNIVLTKMLSLTVLAICLTVMLSGCGAKVAERQPSTIADTLLKELNLPKMILIENDKLDTHFSFPEGVIFDSAVYLSDVDDTADEIGVFKLSDTSKENVVVGEINSQLGQLAKNFKDRFPVEYNKVSNAIIRRVDDCIIVVVCDQNQKAEIILKDMGAKLMN
ncbi:MAG: hypothetical protein BGN88_06910 [Clostridiales bacterium 43-6]|nr:MAG: hypothetical protein BGN88_06910 [Clostridiales bacterium 43-6]